VFNDVEHAASLFNLSNFGNIYSRLSNPTTAVLEERISSLERGRGTTCTSSGHSAQLLALFTLMSPGDTLVASNRLYGGSITQFARTIKKFGWECEFVDVDDIDALREVLDRNRDTVKALWIESLANRTCLKSLSLSLFLSLASRCSSAMREHIYTFILVPCCFALLTQQHPTHLNSAGGVISDIQSLADAAHDNGIPLICDNTLATPYLCQPIEHGADLVVHSTTKFLSGHGNAMGGAVVDSGKFDWAQNDKFPSLTRPEPAYHNLIFYETFGDLAFTIFGHAVGLRDLGPVR